ncbi:hypothetical protein HB364_01520 [Pseudoflavitalea sp. X16]|uniref:hypothetical protein n=1 Tax=Paraflavitalea devenefica TaxID=2716334 RepID=UPI0014244D90|nr:hypothetical protein [Paraflavitalea devenefica]NII23740.1 hypothetical protein [Paraflavitalea devenefica]
MSRFIFFLFILVNNSIIGQTINGFVVTKQAASHTYAITKGLTDSGPVKQSSRTSSGVHTAKVIISSKGICKQSVSSFFIVNIPDTLISQPAAAVQEDTTTATKPARKAGNGQYTLYVAGIAIGGGSDQLELLLKTRGRLTNHEDIARIITEALPSILPVLTLSR